jgi:hypothetical protein
VSDDDFQFLVDCLEEESGEDTDYYITMATIDLLDREGGSQQLLEVLDKAVGGSEGVELSWERE